MLPFRTVICACFAFGLFAALPGPASAAFETLDSGKYDVDGYVVECSVRQKGGDVHLRGRISYGDHCDRLKLTFTIRNEDGKKTKVVAEVGDVGGSGSRTIRAEEILVKRDTNAAVPEWEIVKIQSKCMD